MTAIDIDVAVPAVPTSGSVRPSRARAFLAVLRRDLFVTGRNLWAIVPQVALMPLFMVYVFVNVLGRQGIVAHGFVDVLLPGVVALAAFTTAMLTVALPLAKELGATHEIEDRLLAPLPIGLVAIGKLVTAATRGVLAGAVMYPVAAFVAGSAPWRPAGLPLALLVIVLGSWTGAGIGMTLATVLPVQQIAAVFTLAVTPIIWTGCVHYSWSRLAGVRWFQMVSMINPMTYVSEGVRAELVPGMPHIATWICLSVLAGTSLLFTLAGVAGFTRHVAQ